MARDGLFQRAVVTAETDKFRITRFCMLFAQVSFCIHYSSFWCVSTCSAYRPILTVSNIIRCAGQDDRFWLDVSPSVPYIGLLVIAVQLYYIVSRDSYLWPFDAWNSRVHNIICIDLMWLQQQCVVRQAVVLPTSKSVQLMSELLCMRYRSVVLPSLFVKSCLKVSLASSVSYNQSINQSIDQCD